MAEDKYNLKNPAVKRILQEVKEMQSNPSDDFMSLPLEENIFEWQFAIRGPGETEFEGGIYHGRIQLPAEYPFKPPSFMLLTPNGRFETQTKICLSISNHHPEHWQPSWSERRTLAIKSREAPPKFGTPERQKLIDEIHECMLSKAPPVPQVNSSQAPEEQPTNIDGEAQENLQNAGAIPTGEVQNPPVAVGDRIVEEVHEVPVNTDTSPANVRATREVPSSDLADQLLPKPENRAHKAADDRLFTLAAVGLTIAIVVLLLKKFLKSSGHGALFMDGS
ncbi:ubiquitin-conjugating enzyme e2 32 [Quercus suber]|uniref:Ubiquitin-conjugating enzyme e2 32 n=1 Tax=Quercus suber TaxID=58331 RepID=A0AAW0JWE3_QUESU